MGALALLTSHTVLEGVTGLLYFLVAWQVAVRPTPNRLRNARDAFATWWFILGCLSLLGILLRNTELSEASLVPEFAAFSILLLVTGGSASLVYYQTVLLGRIREPARWIVAYYTTVLGIYFGLVLAAGPRLDTGAGRIVYSEAWLTPGGVLHPLLTVSYFWVLLGPGLVGAAVLLWRTDQIRDPSVRDRAYTIGAALFIWYVFVLVGSISLLSGDVPAWLTSAAKLVNLFAVLTVFLAIHGASQRQRSATGDRRHDGAPAPHDGERSQWIGPLFVRGGASAEINERRILIVDDEPDIVETLKLSIESLSRIPVTVTTTTDALAARHLIATESFDLILSDYRMPQITGADLLEEAYAMSPDTIRVLITGYAERQVVDDAIQRGRVHGYELKPWDTEALIGRIEGWLTDLDQKPAEKGQIVAFLDRTESLV